MPDLAVVKPCGRSLQAVRDAAVGIGANVRFHTEIPVVTLFGGRHLKIARAGLVLVLGRGRCVDDRRINQRA